MNTEAQVIGAIIQNKDMASAMTSGIDSLFVSHDDVWKGLKDYYFKYRALPPIEEVNKKFPHAEIPEAKVATGYAVDEMKNAYAQRALAEVIKQSATDLRTGAGLLALEKMYDRVGALAKITATSKDLDLSDFADAREHMLAVKERVEEMGGSYGIPTGFKAIDASYLTGMAPGHLIVVIGWPGRAKAEPVEKVIPTPTGPTRFGDLVPGDLVWSRTGQPTVVKSIHPQGVIPGLRITFSDGTSGTFGHDHLWSIYCGQRGRARNNLVTLTTQEVLDRGLFRDRDGHKEYKALLPLPEPVQYEKVDLPVEPYTLGALIGDGSYSLDSYNVVLTNNDPEIAQIISDRNPQHSVTENKPFSCRRWAISGLHRVFRENGLCAVRSEKRIPDKYMTAHYEARLELLRGLMDSDGYSGGGRRRAQFSQKNGVLAHQVAELVRSLGGVAKIVESKTRQGMFKVVLWTPDNPFNLKRKADEYRSDPWFKGFESIEPTDDAEMMCISVEAEDSLYLTESYTVTHNTWMTGYLAVKAWERGFKPMIVSLEMSPEVMRDRIYTMMGAGMFSMEGFSRGQIDMDTYDNWSKDYFSEKGGFIVVSNEGVGEVTPNYIQGKIDQHRPDLVIVDYHQLLSDNARSKSPIESARNVSQELKKMALRNSIPIVDVVSATMNDVSDRKGPPMLSQVAWSKAIEYDADHAFAVHKHDGEDGEQSNLVEIVCRKNRHGTEYDFFVDVDLGRGIIRESYEAPH